MEKHKLRARVHKCRFLQDSVDYLGYIVGNGIVKPDPKKTDAITTWKLPRTITELRSFLGMAQQLHRFIPNHAEHTAPFTDYLRGSPKKTDLVAWTPAMIESFESLKQHLASNVATLIIQDPDEPIYLHTDWSLNTLGGWIGQQRDGQIRPIAFESCKLKPSEKKYSPYNGELLALVHCLRAFRPYVRGRKTIIRTDQKALRWLL